MKNFVIRALGGLAMCAAIQIPAVAQEGTVYYLVPTGAIKRFESFDIPNVRAALKKHAPGLELKVYDAGNDVNRQITQVESALANGAKGILISVISANQLGGAVSSAAADKVPVVGLAMDAAAGPLSYQVTVPFEQIGAVHGEYIVKHLPKERPFRLALMLGDPSFSFYTDQMTGLEKQIKPLVDSGDIEIVCRADATYFLPANTQRNMEQCLTSTDNKVDGVFVMTDDGGTAVTAALAAQNLTEKVKIYGGYDATLEGVQRVMLGWQAMDMAPPYAAMADSAVQLLLAAMAGKPAPEGLVNGVAPNGSDTGVPARFEPNVIITADNVQETVVDAGLFTKEQLCSGAGAAAEFCK